MLPGLLLTAGCCLAVFSASAASESFDVLIRNGRVVDGTGNPAFFADVGIKDGRIARIGRLSAEAATVIDAKGMVVAPGFIDVHTHADEVAEMPLAENFVRMGVTTVVAGNCGSSSLDIERFFREIEQTNVAVNVATLVGHNSVRSKAMDGAFDRPPSLEEMERMKTLVDRAMKAGAVGLSTGLIYLPGVFSTTEEIVELTKSITAYDGIYATHMRHEDSSIYAALDEVFRVAREAKVRAEVSHIKLGGPTAWGQADLVLEKLEKARAEGLDVTQDQYAYTASSTGISQLVPESARDGGQTKFIKRVEDPKEKAAIKETMKSNLKRKGREDYSYAVIASYRHDPSLNGLNIVEAAKKSRGSDDLDSQMEMILEIQKNGGASGVFHGMSEGDLKTFMWHPNTMVACDSGLRSFGVGVPHPRGYGNNARVLARYVREQRVLRLEDAIRKMTSLPANTYRFEGRGLLRAGHWADVVVFDPETIEDIAQFNDPHHYPKGIPHVLVNGIPVIRSGEHTRAKAGHALRHRG